VKITSRTARKNSARSMAPSSSRHSGRSRTAVLPADVRSSGPHAETNPGIHFQFQPRFRRSSEMNCVCKQTVRSDGADSFFHSSRRSSLPVLNGRLRRRAYVERCDSMIFRREQRPTLAAINCSIRQSAAAPLSSGAGILRAFRSLPGGAHPTSAVMFGLYWQSAPGHRYIPKRSQG